LKVLAFIINILASWSEPKSRILNILHKIKGDRSIRWYPFARAGFSLSAEGDSQ
jgi:hypothetical protein